MYVPARRGLVYIVAGAALILASRTFGPSGDIIADVVGAGLMWRGHSLRRPRLNDHGFHRAFPYVLALFALGAFVMGPEIAGLARIWTIGWVAWVFLADDRPPGLRQRSRRLAERFGRLRAGMHSPAAAPSAA